MFDNCPCASYFVFNNFDTSNVTNMASMFEGCFQKTPKTESNYMAPSVSTPLIDLRSFDTSNVTNMDEMFAKCIYLQQIYVNESLWKTDKVTQKLNDMFLGCKSIVGELGTKYDDQYRGVAYAHVDKGSADPGYLSTGVKYAKAVLTTDETGKQVFTFYYDAKTHTDDPNVVYIEVSKLGTMKQPAVFDMPYRTYAQTYDYDPPS